MEEGSTKAMTLVHLQYEILWRILNMERGGNFLLLYFQATHLKSHLEIFISTIVSRWPNIISKYSMKYCSWDAKTLLTTSKWKNSKLLSWAEMTD